jgi:D-aspartate ligase
MQDNCGVLNNESYSEISPVPEGPGAILLGGTHGSLALARSLGRRGIPVYYIAGERTLTTASRYVRAFRWPGKADEERIDYLLYLGERFHLQGWTLFAGSDPDALFLSRYAPRLCDKYTVAAPPWSTLRRALDKRLSNQVATALGVSIPWTAYPQNHDELAALNCPMPALLKPAVREGTNAFTQSKAWRATSRSQLLALYDRAASLVNPATIMVQEQIPGLGATQLFSYAAAWWRGAPLASFVAHRGRQYPVDFGFSSTCVETAQAPEVEAAAVKILCALKYHGLVDVEFKLDARDNKYKLLDINPRCWTWQALGCRAGVELGYLLWLAAQDQPIPRVKAQQGTRWLYVSRDLIAAATEIRRGTTSIRSYLSSLAGAKSFAVFAADDPLPAVVELPLLLSRVRNRLTKLRSAQIRDVNGSDRRSGAPRDGRAATG